MDKHRVLIASVLSAIVVLVWLLFFAPKAPAPVVGPPLPPELVAGAAPTPTLEDAPAPQSPALPATSVEGVPGRELRVITERYELVFSSTGGTARSWRLPGFRTTPRKLGETTEAIEMIGGDGADASRRPFAVFSGDGELDGKLAKAAYRMSIEGVEGDPPTELRVGPAERRSLRLEWADGAGASVVKSFDLDGSSYVVGLRASATLPGRTAYVMAGAAIATAVDPGRTDPAAGAVVVSSGGAVERPAYPGKRGSAEELWVRFGDAWPPGERAWLAGLESAGQAARVRAVDWVAIEEMYFAGILFSRQPLPEVVLVPVLVSKDATPRMTVGVPLADGERELSMYVGPKEREQLEAIRPDLVRVINLGFFESLAKGLFWCLAWIHRGVGNWGVAIILLTVVIKIGFLPLTIKQLNTMQKMAKLQPQMKSINDRYARRTGDAQARMESNRQKQQEIMALYQKEGVNPMGGCVPMLLYLPFLYGFYAVLNSAIELRQAPLALWVQDLSIKDPLYVTPILMMISMVVQQAITPSTMDPMQKRIMYVMPIMMTWVFKDLASGLVLFWLTNNVLSIIQQMWMNQLTRRREAEEKENRRGGRKKAAAREAEAE